MKFDISIALVLNVVLWLLVNPANGQVSQIAPEWKAHFKKTPVIEDCVFEREIPASSEFSKGETNLYQFRYQENAFLFRQIRSLNDVSSNNIPTMLDYTGRFESNCWAIDWTADTFGVLKLFPNVDNIWRKRTESGDAMLVYIGERQLFAALYYGIGDLDPATVEWPEEYKFIGRSVSGQKILGEITETSKGRPTVLEWRFEDAPDQQFRFLMEYKYDVNSDLINYPSEIRLSTKEKGSQKLRITYKILMLKISSMPMEESFFNPKRYFVKPSSMHPRVSILLFSNNASYDVSDGHPQKVISSSSMEPIENGLAGKKNIILARSIFGGFFLISVMGLLFIVKHTKTKKQNKQE